MTELENSKHFFINGVQVIPSKNLLVRGACKVALQPKVMGLLEYLAMNHQRVVSTEELIEQLWGGRIVSYGAVPKCITSLRKGLAEFFQDEEIVTNYSKKGYQFTLAPSDFCQQSALDQPEFPAIASGRVQTHYSYRVAWAFVVLLILTTVAALLFVEKSKLVKHHKENFTDRRGFTSETGHERFAEPHPNGKHIVYVRDAYDLDNLEQSSSTLVIRDRHNKEWELDSTTGSWFKLAWSPNATQLLAVEVIRHKGQPLTKNFYEIADYYYLIHVFTLDIGGHRVLSKELIGQWQGRLYSADWWNDATIEIVARQGVNAKNQRYHISLLDKNNPTVFNTPDVKDPPLASALFRGKSAVAFALADNMVINIYSETGQQLATREFLAKNVHLSWTPDGTGVLLYLDYRELKVFYIDGELKSLQLANFRDRSTYRPKYSADGASLFITEKRFKSNILNYTMNGAVVFVTRNELFNYRPEFSPSGEKILYVSVRNNRPQLWLVENKAEMQILEVENDAITDLMWLANEHQFLYKVEDKILMHDLTSGLSSEILLQAEDVYPLGWDDQEQVLTAIITQKDQSNIWTINVQTQKNKQLTHGSIGAAKKRNEFIYFQYIDKDGLWVLDESGREPRLLDDVFPKNSKILSVNAQGLFYITGGSCRESSVYVYDFQSATTRVLQTRNSTLMATAAFHPDRGILGWPCYVPESNIIEYF